MADLTNWGGFFNSTAGDRQYNASTLRNYMKKVIGDGVLALIDNECKVTESDTPAKTVKVNTGFAAIQGGMYQVDAAETLTIDDNSAGNPRIDRVVARIDYTNRKIEMAVLKGTAAASPSVPSLTRDASKYELALAQVAVANGFTTIVNANITDERGDESLCGFAKSLGQQTFEDENDLNRYERTVITQDAIGRATEIEYDRADATLALDRNYSNVDANNYYQTIVERYYLSDGTTVYRTDTYSLTYNSAGVVLTSSRTVVYA
jgi:hypothetical protein